MQPFPRGPARIIAGPGRLYAPERDNSRGLDLTDVNAVHALQHELARWKNYYVVTDGKLPEGATATDLVLMIVEALRKRGVVGKFVEFYGPGLDQLSLADRATVANMAPEYGATCGFFPIDDETLNYLRLTGRDEARVALVETYAKAQGMWRDSAAADSRR